jgi:hypothetical protein
MADFPTICEELDEHSAYPSELFARLKRQSLRIVNVTHVTTLEKPTKKPRFSGLIWKLEGLWANSPMPIAHPSSCSGQSFSQ